MRRFLFLIPVLAVAGAFVLSAGVEAGTSPPPRNWQLNVGGGAASIAVNAFLPDTIQIRKGDSITFTNPYEEFHTVSFVPGELEPPELIIVGEASGGPPPISFNAEVAEPRGPTEFDPNVYYNSGFMLKGDAVTIAFNDVAPVSFTPDDGIADFAFLCIIHPGMEIGVEILGPSSTTPQTQEELTAAGTAALDAHLAQGEAIAADYQVTRSTAADGTANWALVAGDGEGLVDVNRFLPPGALNINVGDTVTWTGRGPAPHTVSFLSGGAAPPLLQGLQLNPQIAAPVGATTYDGTGYRNSGLLGPGFPLQTYSLTFTQAGTYAYVCLLHADQGMAGTIVVGAVAPAPAPAPPGPAPTAPSGTVTAPDTGSGPASSGDTSWLLAGVLLATGTIALAGAGLRAVKDEAR